MTFGRNIQNTLEQSLEFALERSLKNCGL